MKKAAKRAGGLPPDYLEPLVRALADPAVVAGIRVEELDAVVFQLALYFGVRRDPATSQALGAVYARFTEHAVPEARLELAEELAASVRRGATSVLALLPVLQRESDAQVARAAALAFATLAAPEPGDALSGPRNLRTLFEHSEHDAVRAGLVGALLALADPRVQPFVAGLARALSPGARAALLALPRAFASRLEAEWLLAALEDADAAAFADYAAALASLATLGEGRVLDVEREFPAGPDAHTLTVTGEWSREAFAERLAAPLRDLERRAEPGALAGVLRAWGLAG